MAISQLTGKKFFNNNNNVEIRVVNYHYLDEFNHKGESYDAGPGGQALQSEPHERVSPSVYYNTGSLK